MSLLNNMLMDIEKRQAVGATLSANSVLAPRPRSGVSKPLLVLLGIAVAAAAGSVGWRYYRKTAEPVPVIVANVAPAIPAPQPEQAASEVAPAIAESHKESASLAVKESVPVVRSQKGTFQLQMASEMSFTGAPLMVKRENALLAPLPEASFKKMSPQQRSDNFYRQALALMQRSRNVEAQQALMQALDANAANHVARQLLAELLIEEKRNAEAEALLREGVSLAPGYSAYPLTLAHLQAKSGSRDAAIATLEQGLAAAGDDGEYHAYLAALLQKQGRHAEAVGHYLTALNENPVMPGWLIGAGISLRAEGKLDDAVLAFQRALDTGELSAEVAQFARKQLELLRQSRK